MTHLSSFHTPQLQKLDELSPPRKEQPLPRRPLGNQSREPAKTSTVLFANGATTGRSHGPSHSGTRTSAKTVKNAKLPNVRWEKDIGAAASRADSHRSPPKAVGSGHSSEDSEKENVVDGPVLNSAEGREGGGNMDHGDLNFSTSPPVRGSPLPPPGLSAPCSSSSHTLPRSSHTLPSAASLSSHYSPASNPNVIAFSPSRPQHSHSNARAVFGPPVSYGDGRPTRTEVASYLVPVLVANPLFSPPLSLLFSPPSLKGGAKTTTHSEDPHLSSPSLFLQP